MKSRSTCHLYWCNLQGVLILKEPASRVDVGCMLLSYIGVLFVTRPHILFPSSQTKDTDTIAVCCCFAAAFIQAWAYISMRRLQKMHYLAIIHYYSLFCLLLSSVNLLVFGISIHAPQQLKIQLLLIASALLTALGQIFVTQGFQLENAGVASVMRYCDLVFIFIWDTMLLGEHVDGYSILGGGIIIAGAVLIAVNKARSKT